MVLTMSKLNIQDLSTFEELSIEEVNQFGGTQVVVGQNENIESALRRLMKKQADAVLSAAIETIMEAVSENDKVTLVGFGSFEIRIAPNTFNTHGAIDTGNSAAGTGFFLGGCGW